MSFNSTWRMAGVATLAAGLVLSTGCAETRLIGSLDDSELQDPDVLEFAGIGISREINDLMFANLGEYDEFGMGGFTDLVLQGAAGGAGDRSAIGDTRQRDRNGSFEQTQEAVWSAYKIVDLAIAVLPEEEVTASPIVARAWLSGGLMERVMADSFCEAIYQYGPMGGFNLANLEAFQEANGNVQEFTPDVIMGKDSMYTRAAYAFEQAISTAEAALAAGSEEPTAPDGWYDTEQILTAAYGGLAQARAALASLGVDPEANWAAAVAAAQEVPTDFEEYFYNNEDLRNNQEWIIMWTDNEATLWNDTILGEVWGSAFGRHIEPGDERGEIFRCQDFEVKTGTEDDIFQNSNIIDLPAANAECDAPFEPGDIDMEIGTMPRWLNGVRNVRYADIPAVSGHEARLIEAEAALFNNDLPTFTQRINDVRSVRGASLITQPATVGEMEFPNELDDGMSLLDREYLLEQDAEMRRMAHLDRWNHPFVTENATLHPYHRDLMAEATAAGFQRAACWPLPSNECSLNAAIECPDL